MLTYTIHTQTHIPIDIVRDIETYPSYKRKHIHTYPYIHTYFHIHTHIQNT